MIFKDKRWFAIRAHAPKLGCEKSTYFVFKKIEKYETVNRNCCVLKSFLCTQMHFKTGNCAKFESPSNKLSSTRLVQQTDRQTDKQISIYPLDLYWSEGILSE